MNKAAESTVCSFRWHPGQSPGPLKKVPSAVADIRICGKLGKNSCTFLIDVTITHILDDHNPNHMNQDKSANAPCRQHRESADTNNTMRVAKDTPRKGHAISNRTAIIQDH